MMCTVRPSRPAERRVSCAAWSDDARDGARTMHAADDGPARRYYQAGLDLRGRACLVVGGGAVARAQGRGPRRGRRGCDGRRAGSACRCPRASRIALRPFADDDLAGVTLAVAASDDRELNARVARLARERGVWVNVVDEPDEGDVVLPAVVRRGELRIAVSTGGASPALARRIRERLDAEFGPEWGELAALLGRLRDGVGAARDRGRRPAGRAARGLARGARPAAGGAAGGRRRRRGRGAGARRPRARARRGRREAGRQAS